MEADYPESSRQQGQGGRVAVKITLSPTGAIIATSIYKSSGFLALDKSALNATRASSYSPEVEDCQAVGGAYIFAAEYTPPPGTRTPIAVVNSVLPRGSNKLVGIHLSDLSLEFQVRFGFPQPVSHYNVEGFDLIWDDIPLPPIDGVGIDAVLSGSPAYRSGLQAGDVFADVDGTVYRKADSLNDYLSGKKHGDVIRFSVWQNGVKSPSYTLTL